MSSRPVLKKKEGNVRDPYGKGSVLYLDYIDVNILTKIRGNLILNNSQTVKVFYVQVR